MRRVRRRLGGHVRIAVAVAADPRAPAQERRDARAVESPVRGPPVAGASRAASVAVEPRHEQKSDSSKTAIAVRTSSSGSGATERRSDVRHRSEISSRSRRRISRSSDGVRRGSSSRSRSTAQRRSATSAVRRRASVGWAVRTGRDREPLEDLVERRLVAPGPAQPPDRLRHRVVQHAVARRPLAVAEGPAPGRAPRRGSRAGSTARTPR